MCEQPPSSPVAGEAAADSDDVQDIPIAHISLDELAVDDGDDDPSMPKHRKYLRKARTASQDLPAYRAHSSVDVSYTVDDEEDLPAGYASGADVADSDDGLDALDRVDLTKPLDDDEVMPTNTPYGAGRARAGGPVRRLWLSGCV